MNLRNTVEARTDQARVTAAVRSTANFHVSTDDPSRATIALPAPTLALRFKRGSVLPLELSQPKPAPLRRPAPPASAPDAAESAAPAFAALRPEAEAPASARPVMYDSPPPEAPSVPYPEERHGKNHIELIIDSLPHHTLTEPIPVAIESLGDKVFTAWVPNIGIHATGTSIGDTLLALKEQIEDAFGDLNRLAPNLDASQKETLQLLHTYIAPARHRARF